ncbi:MAG TPA: cell envelope integrity protein TolA [Candidatus Paceibacterota bacterium]|nr:cell envelope integrity protein TolA [Candidatus Paceibacterota bacterium]
MERIIGFLCFLFATTAFAGDQTAIDMQQFSGSQATANPTYNFGGPSAVIGLPQHPMSAPPGIYDRLTVPPYALFGVLDRITAQFGEVEISDERDVAQVARENEDARVVFAPMPAFGALKSFPASRPFSAVFTPKLEKRVRLVGSVFFQAKEGRTVLPPADKGHIVALLREVGGHLGRTYVIAIPQGYGVVVGVENEGTTIGVSSVLSHLAQVFVGIGPTASAQDGVTRPIASWGQSYLVLVEDEAEGIPFRVELATPEMVDRERTATKAAKDAERAAEERAQHAERERKIAEELAEAHRVAAEEATKRLAQAAAPKPVAIAPAKRHHPKPAAVAAKASVPCPCDTKK